MKMMSKLKTLIMTLLGSCFGACAQQPYSDMDVTQFEQFLQHDTTVQLVDVRTPEEFAEGHIGGAVNMDVKAADFVSTALSRLDKQRPVAVYCRSGRRSAHAAELLAKQGYKVTNLRGGIMAWQEARKPVEK
jgi:rhodanese-related sulfurtransferase